MPNTTDKELYEAVPDNEVPKLSEIPSDWFHHYFGNRPSVFMRPYVPPAAVGMNVIGRGINGIMDAAYYSAIKDAMHIVGKNLTPYHSEFTTKIEIILKELEGLKPEEPPASTERGEVELLRETVNNQHALILSGEKRGYDKAMEHFKASSEQRVEGERFAEWTSETGWSYWPKFSGTSLQKKQPVWVHESRVGVEPLPTTHELYQIFLQTLKEVHNEKE